MSSQAHTRSLSSGTLIPTRLLNFFARRRVAISLIGFTGFVLVNVFVRKTIPHNPFLLADPFVVLSGALLLTGLAIRSWSAGTLNKSRELTTHGPYAITRNPLYIGSFLMMFAFCILCRDWPTLLFVAGPMAFLYWLQIQFEEQRLSQLFPNDWPDYVRSTPRVFPRFLHRSAFIGWTSVEWLRNREYRTLGATCIGVAAVYVWHVLSLKYW